MLAPIFRDRVAVDVVYDKPLYAAGDVFRCTVELRGGRSLRLLKLVAQLVGSCNSSHGGADALALPPPPSKTSSSSSADDDATFDSWLSAKAGFVGSPPTEPRTFSAGVVPQLGAGSRLTMLSAPVVLDSDLHILARHPVFYTVEFRLPYGLPPTTSSLKFYRYHYALYLTAEHEGFPGHPVQVALPLNICSSGGLLDGAAFVDATIASHPEIVSLSPHAKSFHFCGEARRAARGMDLSEFRHIAMLRQPLPGGHTFLGEPEEFHLAADLLRQRLMNSETPGHKPGHTPSLEVFSAPAVIEMPEEITIAPASSSDEPHFDLELLSDYWGADEYEGASADTQLLGSYRLLHEDVLLGAISIHGRRHREGKVHCRAGESLFIDFDLGAAVWPAVEAHAEIVRAERTKGLPAPKTGVQNFLAYQLGFNSNLSASAQESDVTLVTAEKRVTLHQSFHAVELQVPYWTTPTFESDLVKIEYALTLSLFVLKDAEKNSWISTRSNLLNMSAAANLLHVSYTVDLEVLPPGQSSLPGPDDLPAKINSVASALELGERFRRCHRAFLV